MIRVEDEDEVRTDTINVSWNEVAYVVLSTSVVVLAISAAYHFGSLFADSGDAEKWIVTLTTGLTSLGAALIAYLTAREVRLNDADKKIQKADLDRALTDTRECKEDRRKLHEKQERMQRRIERLMQRMHILDEEDDQGSQEDRDKDREDDEERERQDERDRRRSEIDRDYKGPRRRKGDDPEPPQTPQTEQ